MNYLKTFLPYLFGNKEGESYVFPSDLNWEKLSFEETLMFHALNKTLENFTKTLDLKNLTKLEFNHLISFNKYLSPETLNDLKKHFPEDYELFFKAKKSQALATHEVQEVLNHKNHKLSVFVLLNSERTKPGRLFIRDHKGHFVHINDKKVWSINVLALSRRRLPFNHSNGATPMGIYTIDSVMPEANKEKEFGKFRRLIVNFLAKSPAEENTKQFLPRAHHTKDWWLQGIVGRDLGRSLLRIHGTGEVNKDPFSPYFPMTPSSGCLTITETHLMGLVKPNEQRILLDTLMKAQGLQISYENESKIHGLLYVIEFDGTYQALEFKS